MEKPDADEILKALSEVLGNFSEFSNYTKKRQQSGANAQSIYLDGETCPGGTVPCDPSDGECPEEDLALNPGMYTSEGLRCYSRASMEMLAKRAPEEVKSQQLNIMSIVEGAATLITKIQGKVKHIKCDEFGTEDLCGMKDTCNWANGVCK